MPSRIKALSAIITVTAALSFLSFSVQAKDEPSNIRKFKPTWESMANYQCPEWFRDIKFGIFLHYGLNTVPGFDGHYARHMYWQGKPDLTEGTGWKTFSPNVYNYHIMKYGHPSVFGYKDFLPMWKAEKFDADKLAAFFKKIGARYVVPVAVHCDNFDNWNSRHHRWNSVNMGPERDFIAEWKKACKNHGLKFGVSSHINGGHENIFFRANCDMAGPLKGIAYDTQDPRAADFYGWRTPDRSKRRPEIFGPHFYKRHIDLIDSYQPDLLYFDGPLPYGQYGMKIGAHFLNMNIKKNGPRDNGVLNLKRDFPEGAATLDIEKGQADRLMNHPWQTDTSINYGWFYLGDADNPETAQEAKAQKNHWSEKYKSKDPLRMSAALIVDNMVDIVSKNGNLLLNVGQREDGTIPKIYRDELEKVGKWLNLNGEAIYRTRPWIKYGEGPTQIQTGFNTEPLRPWSKRDFRFTVKGDKFYLIAMDWPTGKSFTVRSLNDKKSALREIKSISLLGHKGRIKWKRDSQGLKIYMPKEKPCEYAFVFKIEQKQTSQYHENKE